MVDDRQAMTLRFTTERYEWLREQAYRHRIPMQQLIDQAIDRLRSTPNWAERLGNETPSRAPTPSSPATAAPSPASPVTRRKS